MVSAANGTIRIYIKKSMSGSTKTIKLIVAYFNGTIYNINIKKGGASVCQRNQMIVSKSVQKLVKY